MPHAAALRIPSCPLTLLLPASRRPRSQLSTLELVRDDWEQLSPLLICGFDVTRASAEALLFRRPKVGGAARLPAQPVLQACPCCGLAAQAVGLPAQAR